MYPGPPAHPSPHGQIQHPHPYPHPHPQAHPHPHSSVIQTQHASISPISSLPPHQQPMPYRPQGTYQQAPTSQPQSATVNPATSFFASSRPQLLSYPTPQATTTSHPTSDEKSSHQDEARITCFRAALMAHVQDIRYNLDAYQTQVGNVTAAMSRMAATISQQANVTASSPPPPRAIDLYEDTQVWPILSKCDTIQLVQLAVMCGLHTHPYVTLDHRQQRKIVKHILRIIRRDGRKLPSTYAHLPTIRLIEHDTYAATSHQLQQTLHTQRNQNLAIQLRDIRTMALIDLLGLCSYETIAFDFSEYLVDRQRMKRTDIARGVAAGDIDEDELTPLEQVKLDVAAINTHIHNNVYELRLSHKHVQQDVTYLQHQQQSVTRNIESLTKRVDKLDEKVGNIGTTINTMSQHIQRVDTSLGIITAILQSMVKNNPTIPPITTTSTPDPSISSLLISLSTSTSHPMSTLDQRIDTITSTLETHQQLSTSLQHKSFQLQEKLASTSQTLQSLVDTNDYVQHMIQQDDIGIPDNNAIMGNDEEEGVVSNQQRRDSSSGQHSMDIACAAHLEFNQSPSSAYTDRGTNLSEQQREALLDDLGLDVMAGISYTCSAASRLYTFLQNHVQATPQELSLDTLYRYQQLSGDGSSWKCSVHFRNLPVTEAIGATKSDAKEIASRNALNLLVQNPHYTHLFMITIPSWQGSNPTSDLINLLATYSRYKEKVIYEFDETKPNLIGCSISYHDRHISWGIASTRAKAKQQASSYALYLLEQAKQLHIATTKAASMIADQPAQQQQQQQPQPQSHLQAPQLPARPSPSIVRHSSPAAPNRPNSISNNPFSSSPSPSNPFTPTTSSPPPSQPKVSLMGRVGSMFGKSVERKDQVGK